MTKSLPFLGAVIGAATFCLPVTLLLVLQLLASGFGGGVGFFLLGLIPACFLGAFTGALSAIAAKKFFGLEVDGPSNSEWPTSQSRPKKHLRSILSSTAIGLTIGAVAGVVGFNGYGWFAITPERLDAGLSASDYGRAVWWLSVIGSVLGGAFGAGLGLVVGLISVLRPNQ